jgi:hypothetical protein
MVKYLEIITNAETGETIERPYTAEEIAEKEQAIKNTEPERLAAMSFQQARESAFAKLAALGLTPEEIAAL